jgi:hypothetical protein
MEGGMRKTIFSLIAIALFMGISVNSFADTEKFNVAIRVSTDNPTLKTLVEGYLRQGLIAVGDVKIVSPDQVDFTNESLKTILVMVEPISNDGNSGHAVSSIFLSTYTRSFFKQYFVPIDDSKAISYLSRLIFDENQTEFEGFNIAVAKEGRIISIIDQIIKLFNRDVLDPQRVSAEDQSVKFEKMFGASQH